MSVTKHYQQNEKHLGGLFRMHKLSHTKVIFNYCEYINYLQNYVTLFHITSSKHIMTASVTIVQLFS